MQILVWGLVYLGAGVSTNLFLFHFPAVLRKRDPVVERLRIAASIPPLAQVREQGGDQLAARAVALGIVVLWPLFVIPLLRWVASLDR